MGRGPRRDAGEAPRPGFLRARPVARRPYAPAQRSFGASKGRLGDMAAFHTALGRRLQIQIAALSFGIGRCSRTLAARINARGMGFRSAISSGFPPIAGAGLRSDYRGRTLQMPAGRMVRPAPAIRSWLKLGSACRHSLDPRKSFESYLGTMPCITHFRASSGECGLKFRM